MHTPTIVVMPDRRAVLIRTPARRSLEFGSRGAAERYLARGWRWWQSAPGGQLLSWEASVVLDDRPVPTRAMLEPLAAGAATTGLAVVLLTLSLAAGQPEAPSTWIAGLLGLVLLALAAGLTGLGCGLVRYHQVRTRLHLRTGARAA